MIPTDRIADYVKSGKKIQAIKLVHDSMGISLKEAREYVDKLEHTMRMTTLKLERESYVSSVSAIDGMEGHEFEYFCANLLRKVGFLEVEVTPGSGDQGVDILAVKDGVKYAIQCKNYVSALGNTPVQEVSAGKQFYGCHVGVVLTNSTFTPGAIQLAIATNVLLWDRNKLEELILKAGGLASLGIYTNYTDFDDDELEEIDGENFEEVFTDYIKSSNVTCSRIGMKIWFGICIGWSILCFLIFLGGLCSNNQQIMVIGLGEGLFVLVLGIMFGVLSKTEKGNPYMNFGRKSIKKWVFVVLSIVLAYMLFISAMMAMGGFKLEKFN